MLCSKNCTAAVGPWQSRTHSIVNFLISLEPLRVQNVINPKNEWMIQTNHDIVNITIVMKFWLLDCLSSIHSRSISILNPKCFIFHPPNSNLLYPISILLRKLFFLHPNPKWQQLLQGLNY